VLYHRGSGPAAANDYSWLLCRKKGTQDCVESYEVTRSQLTVHVRSNQQKGFVVTWKTADSKAK
jgi:hypothetical protein